MSQVFEARTLLDLAETTHQLHPRSTIEELFIQQALFRTFLLAYGKCFSESGKGRSSLDHRKVFDGQDEARKTHERIMFLRHKSAAHSDESGLDEAAIQVEERNDEFVIFHRYAIAIPLNEYSAYRVCTKGLEEYVVDQVNRTISSLERDLGKTIRVESASSQVVHSK